MMFRISAAKPPVPRQAQTRKQVLSSTVVVMSPVRTVRPAPSALPQRDFCELRWV